MHVCIYRERRTKSSACACVVFVYFPCLGLLSDSPSVVSGGIEPAFYPPHMLWFHRKNAVFGTSKLRA